MSTSKELNEDVKVRNALQEALGDKSAMVGGNEDFPRPRHIDELRSPGSRSCQHEPRNYNNRLKETQKKMDLSSLGSEPSKIAPEREFLESEPYAGPPSTTEYAASTTNYSTLAQHPTPSMSQSRSATIGGYRSHLRIEVMSRLKTINKYRVDPETQKKLTMIYGILSRPAVKDEDDPVRNYFNNTAKDGELYEWDVKDTINVMINMFG